MRRFRTARVGSARMLALTLALTAVAAAPELALAQQPGACQLVRSESLERRTVGVYQTVYVVAPVVECSGGARVRADEGTVYQAQNEVHLFGNVDFRDPERRLTSRQAIYSSVTGRLHATGDVVFTDHAEGMTLSGPELEYFRAMPGRPQSQAIATQRPHLTLQPKPRPGQEQPEDSEPIEIDADRMTMLGNEQYTATGRVTIHRSDFQAVSREARVDQVAERMELRGSAHIQGEQFDLAGEEIDMLMPGDRLERLDARDDAELVGEDLRIDAGRIHLFFADDEVQRMVATEGRAPAPRPIATARAFRLEADSIDALTPDQLLDRVIAIGNARGESLDTTDAPTGRIPRPAPAGELTAADRDWIVGDTVIGYFVAAPAVETATQAAAAGAEEAAPTGDPVDAALPLAVREQDEPDESGEPAASNGGPVELDRLVAIGSARSLYRVENNDEQRRGRHGLNYLVGETIELAFAGGELRVADVRGLQRGLYLDPRDAPPSPAEPDAEPDGEPDDPADDPAAEPPPASVRS